MKKLFLTLAMVGIAGLVLAETDPIAGKRLKEIAKGTTAEKYRIDDLYVQDDATINDDLTVNGDIAVTGNSTLSGTLDVDSVTVDAGAGIDNQAAGALLVGAATATSVEIADTGVATDIQGTLSVDEAAVFDSTIQVTGAAQFDTDTDVIGTLKSQGPFVAEKNITFADTNNVARTWTVSDDYTWITTPNELIGTVTNSQEISIVSTWNIIDAAGAVTCTVANADAKGQFINLINDGAATITFADSGNLKLSGDAVLGQYDTLSLYAAATNVWVETGQQDN